MTVQDFRLIDTEIPIEADLCLIGSGPAAYTIAEELRNTDLRIVVLESGGLSPELDTDALNDIEDVGVPIFRRGRERVLGGTSYTWAGRCVPFGEMDYAARPWVLYSGWPIGSDTIAPYLNEAAKYLGGNPFSPDGRESEPPNLPERPLVDDTLLRSVSWEVADPVRFGPLFLSSANGNVRVILHATVTHVNTEPTDGRFHSVEIAASHDKRATVRARAAVLCAGGIENARILLNSNRNVSSGVGNRYDLVGRFLMDHPRDNTMVVRFQTRDAARVRNMFGPYRFDNARSWSNFFRGFELSADLQRQEGLLNCAAWPDDNKSLDDPIEAMKRLIQGPRNAAMRDIASVVSQPRGLFGGLQARLKPHQRFGNKVDRIGFVACSEQIPDPQSRVDLSQHRDALGLPIARVDWRVSDRDKASQARLAQLMASEFRRLGLPPVELAEWARAGRHAEAILVDACHPTGTTRMATSPRAGVVDADCEVHGAPGVYVAGSSVFPTAGHANPTLMIVAFAVRLAHRLRQRLEATNSSLQFADQPV